VVVFQAALAQFWDGHIGVVWRGCPTTWNVWHWPFMVPGIILDIL